MEVCHYHKYASTGTSVTGNITKKFVAEEVNVIILNCVAKDIQRYAKPLKRMVFVETIVHTTIKQEVEEKVTKVVTKEKGKEISMKKNK